MIAKDVGFITKRFNFRDTSIITTIYTKKFGKINGLFKGFYTNKKEFSSSLDMYTLNEFVFYPRTSDIWLVSYADIISNYCFLRSDFKKNSAASMITSVVNKATMLQDKNTKVFTLLKKTLDAIFDYPDKRIVYIFLIKFLTISGFKPEFNLCMSCHGQYENQVFFSVLAGGLLCEKCKNAYPDAHKICLETSNTISYIQNKDFSRALRVNPTHKCENEIISILKRFLEYHLSMDPFFIFSEQKPLMNSV